MPDNVMEKPVQASRLASRPMNDVVWSDSTHAADHGASESLNLPMNILMNNENTRPGKHLLRAAVLSFTNSL